MQAYNRDITVGEFIARYARPYDPTTDNYFREPFAQDTKVGKNSAIYNVHSFHTKVPPEGIVPYILHYTNPGDLILDPFCGSGMTGVAAMMCARPPYSLIVPGAQLGVRKAILNDLSPAACHIAYNYTHPAEAKALKAEFDWIMQKLQSEFDWLYGTTCDRCGGRATIQYTIWSDVFRCSRCRESMILWDVAIDHQTGQAKEPFACPSCGFTGKKTHHKRADSIPVLTNYECEGECKPKRSVHRTTAAELQLIAEIEVREIPHWYPTDPFSPDREMWRGGHRDAGVTRVCDFYTKRNLWALAAVWAHVDQRFRFQVTAVARLASRMAKVGLGHYFHKSGGPINAGITTTLYIPGYSAEQNVAKLIESRFRKTELTQLRPTQIMVSCSSAASLNEIDEDTVDYVFTDPPFGSNIFYADCSLLWEAWLQDFTDVRQEAVWNKSLKPDEGGKTLADYAAIMAKCFEEIYRVLKPGRWASVIFSNSDDRVWQVIRDGAATAGFEMADKPYVLDKKQRSFKQIKGEKGEENVVGTDIIMNLHKRPRVQVVVQSVPDLDETVLGILRHHLETLPERVRLDATRYSDALRTTDALYSVVLQELMERKLSNRGVTMPYIDELCRSAFKKVAGKWYLPSEEIRAERLNLEVEDEPLAIEWVRTQLAGRPMTLAELVPPWRQATLKVGNRLAKTLPQLLEENFWCDTDTNRWRLPTEDERRQMGDERTLRIRRNIQRLRDGKLDTLPKDIDLFEWMVFAYRHLADHRAVVEVYQRLNPSNLAESDRRQAKGLYEFCLMQLPETDNANRSNQLRLL